MSEAEQLPLPATPNTQPGEEAKATTPQVGVKDDVKTIMKEFSFQLTDTDLAKKATQLGELQAELDSATAKLDAAKGDYKSTEAQIKVAHRNIIDAVRTRREMRSVWCEEVHDFEHGRVYWRPKNGNPSDPVLGERPMTNDERQIKMKLDEKKAEDAKKSADAKKPGAEYEKAAKEQPQETEIKTDAQWNALKDGEQPPSA